MTSSEAARHSLYARLQEVLGPEHADTLMTSLPIDPGAELATKSDIELLRAEIKEIRSTCSNSSGPTWPQRSVQWPPSPRSSG